MLKLFIEKLTEKVIETIDEHNSTCVVKFCYLNKCLKVYGFSELEFLVNNSKEPKFEFYLSEQYSKQVIAKIEYYIQI
jgi:hypothetical protein